MIGHASKDENNQLRNGKAGDQTKKEVCIRTWYNRPWNVVLRCKDTIKAEKIAVAMEKACANNKIGYDQVQRNTLWKQVFNKSFDPSKADVDCEVDCSSLVCVCCAYAGIPIQYLQYGNNSLTTSIMKNMLTKSGCFEALTDKKYLTSDRYLLRGDILLYEGHHTAIVLNDGDGVMMKSIETIAREVIKGLWGSGQARKNKLTEAGYDYSEVQAKVNELLKPRLSIIEVARQVINREWGNGEERKKRLTEAGYDYLEVQKQVNELLKPKDTAKVIWDFISAKIDNPYGVAGLMGNLKAESNLKPTNLQNSFEKKIGFLDDTYTAAVDNGVYTNFIKDSAGYGLAQWTYWSRKQGLLEYAKSKGSSVGDLNTQLEYLFKELNNSYKGVLNGLKGAKSVREASDIVLTQFEKPRDQSESVKEYRASLSQEIYDKYGR